MKRELSPEGPVPKRPKVSKEGNEWLPGLDALRLYASKDGWSLAKLMVHSGFVSICGYTTISRAAGTAMLSCMVNPEALDRDLCAAHYGPEAHDMWPSELRCSVLLDHKQYKVVDYKSSCCPHGFDVVLGSHCPLALGLLLQLIRQQPSVDTDLHEHGHQAFELAAAYTHLGDVDCAPCTSCPLLPLASDPGLLLSELPTSLLQRDHLEDKSTGPANLVAAPPPHEYGPLRLRQWNYSGADDWMDSVGVCRGGVKADEASKHQHAGQGAQSWQVQHVSLEAAKKLLEHLLTAWDTVVLGGWEYRYQVINKAQQLLVGQPPQPLPALTLLGRAMAQYLRETGLPVDLTQPLKLMMALRNCLLCCDLPPWLRRAWTKQLGRWRAQLVDQQITRPVVCTPYCLHTFLSVLEEAEILARHGWVHGALTRAMLGEPVHQFTCPDMLLAEKPSLLRLRLRYLDLVGCHQAYHNLAVSQELWPEAARKLLTLGGRSNLYLAIQYVEEHIAEPAVALDCMMVLMEAKDLDLVERLQVAATLMLALREKLDQYEMDDTGVICYDWTSTDVVKFMRSFVEGVVQVLFTHYDEDLRGPCSAPQLSEVLEKLTKVEGPGGGSREASHDGSMSIERTDPRGSITNDLVKTTYLQVIPLQVDDYLVTASLAVQCVHSLFSSELLFCQLSPDPGREDPEVIRQVLRHPVIQQGGRQVQAQAALEAVVATLWMTPPYLQESDRSSLVLTLAQFLKTMGQRKLATITASLAYRFLFIRDRSLVNNIAVTMLELAVLDSPVLENSTLSNILGGSGLPKPSGVAEASTLYDNAPSMKDPSNNEGPKPCRSCPACLDPRSSEPCHLVTSLRLSLEDNPLPLQDLGDQGGRAESQCSQPGDTGDVNTEELLAGGQEEIEQGEEVDSRILEEEPRVQGSSMGCQSSEGAGKQLDENEFGAEAPPPQTGSVVVAPGAERSTPTPSLSPVMMPATASCSAASAYPPIASYLVRQLKVTRVEDLRATELDFLKLAQYLRGRGASFSTVHRLFLAGWCCAVCQPIPSGPLPSWTGWYSGLVGIRQLLISRNNDPGAQSKVDKWQGFPSDSWSSFCSQQATGGAMPLTNYLAWWELAWKEQVSSAGRTSQEDPQDYWLDLFLASQLAAYGQDADPRLLPLACGLWEHGLLAESMVLVRFCVLPRKLTGMRLVEEQCLSWLLCQLLEWELSGQAPQVPPELLKDMTITLMTIGGYAVPRLAWQVKHVVAGIISHLQGLADSLWSSSMMRFSFPDSMGYDPYVRWLSSTVDNCILGSLLSLSGEEGERARRQFVELLTRQQGPSIPPIRWTLKWYLTRASLKRGIIQQPELVAMMLSSCLKQAWTSLKPQPPNPSGTATKADATVPPAELSVDQWLKQTVPGQPAPTSNFTKEWNLMAHILNVITSHLLLPAEGQPASEGLEQIFTNLLQLRGPGLMSVAAPLLKRYFEAPDAGQWFRDKGSQLLERCLVPHCGPPSEVLGHPSWMDKTFLPNLQFFVNSTDLMQRLPSSLVRSLAVTFWVKEGTANAWHLANKLLTTCDEVEGRAPQAVVLKMPCGLSEITTTKLTGVTELHDELVQCLLVRHARVLGEGWQKNGVLSWMLFQMYVMEGKQEKVGACLLPHLQRGGSLDQDQITHCKALVDLCLATNYPPGLTQLPWFSELRDCLTMNRLEVNLESNSLRWGALKGAPEDLSQVKIGSLTLLAMRIHTLMQRIRSDVPNVETRHSWSQQAGFVPSIQAGATAYSMTHISTSVVEDMLKCRLVPLPTEMSFLLQPQSLPVVVRALSLVLTLEEQQLGADLALYWAKAPTDVRQKFTLMLGGENTWKQLGKLPVVCKALGEACYTHRSSLELYFKLRPGDDSKLLPSRVLNHLWGPQDHLASYLSRNFTLAQLGQMRRDLCPWGPREGSATKAMQAQELAEVIKALRRAGKLSLPDSFTLYRRH